MNKHTPTPWRVDPSFWGDIETIDGRIQICTVDEDGDTAFASPKHKEAKANAEFIVRAVNCHDELVEALQAQEDAEEWIANADQTDPFFEETYRHKLTCCAALRSKALAKAGKGEG